MGGAARVGSDTGNINRSLLTLSRVIAALASKEGRVPYRDSKLTRLCADALGGRCTTMMIGTLAPSRGKGDDARTALEFLARAREALNLSQTPLEERLARSFLLAREQLAEAEVAMHRLEAEAAAAAEAAAFRLAEAERWLLSPSRKPVVGLDAGTDGGTFDRIGAGANGARRRDAEVASHGAAAGRIGESGGDERA